ITVERYPDGVKQGAPSFWQKNTPSYYPKWIKRIKIPTGTGKDVEYALINDERALLYFVNQGAITFHIYFSRIASLQRPDFVLFDLDPGGAPLKNVMTIARELYTALEASGVESFLKTSGKSGLHILTPWTRGSYDQARAWATQIAQQVANTLSDI